ncbi:MAG: 4-demethylwyosine synthase TYW1 [Candidatus ainarchaeum sp.]|nr:4-demethylwyosine synthase TYW1 [Candidatus ainarchaeum sp.]
MQLTPSQEKMLKGRQYGLVGKQGAVQICEWTKKSLRDQDDCYKNKFYGVKTYSCAQITPNVLTCDQNCIFCWRPLEMYNTKKISKKEAIKPKELVDKLVKERRLLLIGFKGYEKVNRKKLTASIEEFPKHWAISLSGEPTLYPYLPELVKELKKHKVESIFVVTNGQNPEMLKKLKEKKALPSQLYLSLVAYDPKSYAQINKGVSRDGFKALKKSLNLLKTLKVRSVIRVTLIKGYNTEKEQLEKLAGLIEGSGADFVEVKAYMWIGDSRKKLGQENMPLFSEIKDYTKILLKSLKDYKKENECEASRIILLKNKKSKYNTKLIAR